MIQTIKNIFKSSESKPEGQTLAEIGKDLCIPELELLYNDFKEDEIHTLSRGERKEVLRFKPDEQRCNKCSGKVIKKGFDLLVDINGTADSLSVSYTEKSPGYFVLDGTGRTTDEKGDIILPKLHGPSIQAVSRKVQNLTRNDLGPHDPNRAINSYSHIHMHTVGKECKGLHIK